MAPTTRASSPVTLVDPERLDTTSTTDGHGDGGRDDAPQRRPGFGLGQAAEPLAEDDQGHAGGDGVGDGEGEREAADPERVHEDDGQDDVEGILHEVEVEGDLGALHGLQDADEVEVGAEAGQPEGEQRQGGARGRRLGRRAVPVAEEQRHGGTRQQQHAHRGRDDERQDGAQAARHAMEEGGPLPGRPLLGQVGRDDGHHRDRDHAVGKLEEGVGVGVRRHRVRPGDAARPAR